VTAAEIDSLHEAAEIELSHRLVRFAVRYRSAVTRLTTADDVFEEVAAGSGIRATADALVNICNVVDRVAPEYESVPAGAFEVVASFIGRRNYTRFDIEDHLGEKLRRRFGGVFKSRRHGPPSHVETSYRAHLWDDRIVLGLRVSTRPLHRRDYRLATVPGSLHPPVARAMSLVARIRDRDRVFDPCCGAGTLLIEAGGSAALGSVVGMDINADHVGVALQNAERAGIPLVGLSGDAARVPLADGCVDLVLANPPWGSQVAASGQLAIDKRPFWQELRRVLCSEGRAAVLVDSTIGHPEWSELGLVLDRELAISIGGRWTSLYVLGARPTHTVPAETLIGQALQRWASAAQLPVMVSSSGRD